MKLGTENKTKTAIAAGLLVVAAFALYNWIHSSDEAADASSRSVGDSAASRGGAETGKTGGAQKRAGGAGAVA